MNASVFLDINIILKFFSIFDNWILISSVASRLLRHLVFILAYHGNPDLNKYVVANGKRNSMACFDIIGYSTSRFPQNTFNDTSSNLAFN